MIRLFFLLLCLCFTDSSAQTDAAIQSDELEYDETTKKLTARGHVVVDKRPHVLKSSELWYDDKLKIYTSPHSFTYEGLGYTLRAEEGRLGEGLKWGEAKKVTLTTPDAAWLKADAIHFSDQEKRIEKGIYSACTACPEGKCSTPFWQLEADKVTLTAGEVRYEKPTLRIKGKKILTLKKFSHSDFSQKRKSGFLFPSARLSRGGFDVGMPYYHVIAPNRDLTFTPRVSTFGDVEGALEYRHLFQKGSMELGGTLARFSVIHDGHKTRKGSFEGFLNSKGTYQFSENVIGSFAAKRSTRRGYPSEGELIFDDHYKSFMTVEGAWDRGSLKVGTDWYQGLRETDRPENAPLVLPEVMAQYALVKDEGLGNLMLKGSSVFVHRDLGGLKSKRGTLELEWDKTLKDRRGMVYALYGLGRGDVYHQEKRRLPGNFKSRFYPVGGLEWRYPLVVSGFVPSIVEPRVSVVLSPTGLNRRTILNDDSFGFMLTEASLYAPNQAPGFDRVSEGGRINYGLSWTATPKKGGDLRAFLGQSVLMYGKPFDRNTKATGLHKGLSNCVGSLTWNPSDTLKFAYISHYNPHLRRLTHHVAQAEVTWGWTRLFSELASVPRHTHSVDPKDILFLHQGLSQKLSAFWYTEGAIRFDLIRGRMATAEWGFTYKNDCFAAKIQVSRTFAHDYRREKSWGVTFMMGLRTIGGYEEIKTFPSKPLGG